MGLFGGCGNSGNDSSWIWIIIIVVFVLCLSDGNIFGGNNNCCCDPCDDRCC